MNLSYSIDYAQDALYGFNKPFFFSLDLIYAKRSLNLFFFKENGEAISTKDFLKKNEDKLTGINNLLFSWEEEGKILSEQDHLLIETLRLQFREKTKDIKKWPFSQFLFSIIYITLINNCCPYQSLVWEVLWKTPRSQEAKQFHGFLKTSLANNVTNVGNYLLLEKLVLLEHSYISPENLEKQKEVKNTDSSFWFSILRAFFFREDQEKLSMEVLDLFLAFVRNNSGFTREFPALRQAVLELIDDRRWVTGNEPPEKELFDLFILIPLFELFDISPLKIRLACLAYKKTKDLKVLKNLLYENEKEVIKE